MEAFFASVSAPLASEACLPLTPTSSWSCLPTSSPSRLHYWSVEVGAAVVAAFPVWAQRRDVAVESLLLQLLALLLLLLLVVLVTVVVALASGLRRTLFHQLLFLPIYLFTLSGYFFLPPTQLLERIAVRPVLL